MQTVPNEVQSLILQYLDPSSLHSAYQVCKPWHQTIQQDGFCQSYAQSRTTQEMKALTPEFFEKLLPFFSPEQLFYINGKNITRHGVDRIFETKSNQLNLRIVKLLSSLDWYQEIIQQNKDCLAKDWHWTDPYRSKQFEESLPYIHLLMMGHSSYFTTIKGSKSSYERLAGYPITKELDLNNLEYEVKLLQMERICTIDYCALKILDAKILDMLFQAVFCRYRLTHLMNPTSINCLDLPTDMFKGLFASLTSQYSEPNIDHPLESKAVSSISSWSFFKIPRMILNYLPYFQHDIRTEGVGNALIEGAFKSLRIVIDNDEKLECLSKWIESTPLSMEKLELFFWIRSNNHNITVEAMKAFGKSLFKSNVKSIRFIFENHMKQEVVDIAHQIENSLKPNSQ